jgi:thiosulfate/3-mercaptopyruvate sulfurtransferase
MTTDISSPLVSVSDLYALIREPNVGVFDVRWYLGEPDRGRNDYEAAHIPDAVFVDLETHLSAPRGPGRHPLPSPVRFAATVGRLGIEPETIVVAYDGLGGATSSRLWWMLRRLGHRRVHVLDGGFGAWQSAGMPTESGVVVAQPVGYPVLMSAWPTTIAVDELIATSDNVIIDSRASERYRGAVEMVYARPGPIPGAVNLPFTDKLGESGSHHSTDVLAERFAGIGPEPIVYCGSGVTACANILAMEVAGITDARLYPGSWSDWASRAELEAVVGPNP